MESEKLNNRQEIYIRELLSGKSQREAYKSAYPKSVEWKDYSVDIRASKLMQIDKVKLRYAELKKEAETAAIMSFQERQELLSTLARSPQVKDRDRIIAVEVLGKMKGDFVMKYQNVTPPTIVDNIPVYGDEEDEE